MKYMSFNNLLGEHALQMCLGRRLHKHKQYEIKRQFVEL